MMALKRPIIGRKLDRGGLSLNAATWESLISPTLYEQYKNTPIPVRNTLATPVATTIVQGQSIDPQRTGC